MTPDMRRSVSEGAVSGTATFSSSRSFQLFMEGLRELRAYESAPTPGLLHTARASLSRCVESYPSDALPRFYLGIVRTLEGYSGLDEAIRLFGRLKDEGPGFLRLPATYNLAAAYVEKYDLESARRAEELLTHVKTHLREEPLQTVPKVALNAQAAGLLAYLAVARLEPSRTDRRPANETALVETARAALKAATESASVSGIPSSVKRDVLADIANAQAMLFEYEARSLPDAERMPKALLAEENYLRALQYKRDWLPVLSNLARIYQELLSRHKDAEQLWSRVLQIRPGDEYSHYMLGKLLESTDLPRAFGHYWIAGQAGYIPGAARKLIELEAKIPVRLLPKGYRTPSSPSPTPEGGSTH